MLAKKGKKYPRLKVLVVHPTKWVRDKVSAYIEQEFGCKVTTTTNHDRAINKLEKAVTAGGPAAKFHMVVSAYDIACPETGSDNQGPSLVQSIRNHPLLKDVSIILESAGNRVTDVDANAFVPSLEKMEAV